jgi:hypothetical protein
MVHEGTKNTKKRPQDGQMCPAFASCNNPVFLLYWCHSCSVFFVHLVES